MYKTRNHWDKTTIFCIVHGVSLILYFIHIYSHFNYMYLFKRLSAWLNFILFDIHVFCPTFLLRVLNTHCNFCVNAKSKISFKNGVLPQERFPKSILKNVNKHLPRGGARWRRIWGDSRNLGMVIYFLKRSAAYLYKDHYVVCITN